jgi:hypothetical protein
MALLLHPIGRFLLFLSVALALLATLLAALFRFHPNLYESLLQHTFYASPRFRLTSEFQLVPEGYILPPGLDIRIDMQTGEAWAKLPSGVKDRNDASSDAGVVLLDEQTSEDAGKAPESDSREPFEDASRVPESDSRESSEARHSAPAYSNSSKKWRHRFAAVSELIEGALRDLQVDELRDDSLALLLDEASALEVGAGILHSENIGLLLGLIDSKNDSNEDALTVLAVCLQNNHAAVVRAAEIGILDSHVYPLLASTKDNKLVRRCIQIGNAFLINGDEGKPEPQCLEQLSRFPELIFGYFKAHVGRLPRSGGFSERHLDMIVAVCRMTGQLEMLQSIAGEMRRNRGLELIFCPRYSQFCKD